MATKKSSGATKKSTGTTNSAPSAIITERDELLARVAGNVASGVITAPTDATVSAEGIAAIAVDVAEEILKKIGL